jgi:mono/diheme cytochrome c family protein
MLCKLPRLMACLGSLTLMCCPLLGQAWAGAANGERLARQWCASCHVVASDQKQASADVPAFSTIARVSGFTRDKLAFFLLDPHPKMPNMSLTRNEATDLADYIISLAPR